MDGTSPELCGCWTGAWWGVTPPPRCPAHGGMPTTAGASTAIAPFTTTVKWPPIPQCLSDDDVERIAKRLAQLLKESA